MIKGVHYVRIRRPGRMSRWYVYAYRGGPLVWKGDSAVKPRLERKDVQFIMDALEAPKKVDPTIFRSLIREWRSCDAQRASSPEWSALSAGTKRTWGSALDLIDEKWGDTPLEIWNDPRMTSKVVAWRDSRAATPRGADIGVMVLRQLLKFGRLRGKVAVNVAADIPTLYRNGQRAEIVWSDDDIERFAEAARKLDRIQMLDGLRLAALTGLRREDLVTLTWDDVRDDAIVKLALKRSRGKRRRVTMPRIPALDELLEELRGRTRKEGVNTVLVNSHGEAWSVSGFGGSFTRVRDAAGIVHVDPETGESVSKHLHDVRGTFCTKLLTIGHLTDGQVADIMGWSVDKVSTIRKVYVDQTEVVRALGKRLRELGAGGAS